MFRQACFLILLFVFALAAGCGESLGDRGDRLEQQVNPPAVESERWVRWNSCYLHQHRATWTWKTYRNLLTLLADPRYVVVPLNALATAKAEHPDKVVVGLRHDMDGNLCKAGTMARIEKARGFQATYYIRHTDPYYGWGWPDVIRRTSIFHHFTALQNLGHEVGLHNDMLTLAVAYDLDEAEVLAAELLYLRKGGLRISGVAAHGSSLAHTADFVNYEVFSGMTTRESMTARGREVALGTLRLTDFSLQYEAYHLPYEHYFTDVGGHWGERDPFAELAAIPAGEAAVVLTHPVWWGSDEEELEYVGEGL